MLPALLGSLGVHDLCRRVVGAGGAERKQLSKAVGVQRLQWNMEGGVSSCPTRTSANYISLVLCGRPFLEASGSFEAAVPTEGGMWGGGDGSGLPRFN